MKKPNRTSTFIVSDTPAPRVRDVKRQLEGQERGVSREASAGCPRTPALTGFHVTCEQTETWRQTGSSETTEKEEEPSCKPRLFRFYSLRAAHFSDLPLIPPTVTEMEQMELGYECVTLQLVCAHTHVFRKSMYRRPFRGKLMS